MRKKLEYKLLDACGKGGIEKVISYLMMEDSPDINCSLEVVKNLFYTPLLMAIDCNHFELVKYLLTSPELKKHADINQVTCNRCALSIAIQHQSEDIIDFLLHSPELKEHAVICPTEKLIELEVVNGEKKALIKNIQCHSPLERAILLNNTNIIHILLNKPELKNNPHVIKEVIEENISALFRHQHIEMFTYLLVNGYIKKDNQLEQHLNAISDKDFHQKIKNIIDNLILKDLLENNLKENSQYHINNLRRKL